MLHVNINLCVAKYLTIFALLNILQNSYMTCNDVPSALCLIVVKCEYI